MAVYVIARSLQSWKLSKKVSGVKLSSPRAQTMQG